MALRALTPLWRQLQETARASARLLVVDDEVSVRMVLREFFADEGIAVATVESAEEALAALDRERFDLVLVDKNLPAASGLELLARLRDRPAIQSLLITGFPSVETVAEALAHGAADYLAKPFDMEHVQSRVRALLDRSARQAVFERIVADVHQLLAGADAAIVNDLKRRLETTRRHIDAASGIIIVGDVELEPDALARAIDAPPAVCVVRGGVAEVFDQIADGASPRVVVLALDASDQTGTVRQLKAADPSLEILLVARSAEVARLLSVIHAGAADFVLPTVEGLPLLARRVRRLADRVRRRRLYLGLLSALHRFAVARDPESAEEVLAIAAPVERRLVRNGFGGRAPARKDVDEDDLPTLERLFADGGPL
ncbi:MAG TPA: response regulator [Polyangia bacterium]|jgi:DNA-binding NtrC family response regulator